MDEGRDNQNASFVNQAAAPHSLRKLAIIASITVLVGIGICMWLATSFHSTPHTNKASTAIPAATIKTPTTTVKGLQLDIKKNYGNKYANGLLPVGDGKYSTTSAHQGSIYACGTYAQNLKGTQGGAGSRGPWFTTNNTQYNITKKVRVGGSVMWQAAFTNTVSGEVRTITTNGLPTHPTGIFPILSTDPAYTYDRNPNSIKAQETTTYTLPSAAVYGDPNCMSGEAGIMLTGVALFNAFDAGGRDAGAWEVQDSCGGHPQIQGLYHYHTLSSCIKDTSYKTVMGFANDGFPITGPQVGVNNILTTSDLDECHGITSQIVLDGKTVTMYHYVMTQDFPYSVSCFRGRATQPTNKQSATNQPSQPPSQCSTASNACTHP